MEQKPVVLAAAASPGFAGSLRDLFAEAGHELRLAGSSVLALKTALQKEKPALVVLVTPLPDEYGIRSACEIAHAFHVQVLLFVPADRYDQAVYRSQDSNVFVLGLPVSKRLAFQTLHILEKTRFQVQKLEKDLARSKARERENQLISRCKLLLMEQCKWTEQKAHKYIEKQAMDHSTTKAGIAKVLVEKMEARAHA